MTSDDLLRDDGMETVRDQEPASPDRAAAPTGGIDTGVMMDKADSGTIDRTDVGEPGDADAGEPGR